MNPIPDSERTVIVRPRSGARASGLPHEGVPDGHAPPPTSHAVSPATVAQRNPILTLAQPLLALVSSIRLSPRHPNPAGLRESLLNELAVFEKKAQAANLPREQVIGAKYVLCSSLDEAAASTPWGGESWSGDTLLMRLFNESWGGEKVFQLLTKLAEQPRKNIDLLELLYVCLCLGFEGRYRVVADGKRQLEQLRARLHQILRMQRGPAEAALSPGWQTHAGRTRGWSAELPVWVLWAGVAFVALAVYAGFGFALANRSDPVFASMQQIRLENRVRIAPAPAAAPRLAVLLATESSAGLLRVDDHANRSVVTLNGDAFFEPGSAAVSQRGLDLLDRVGQALASVPGSVIISGHTDAQPIRTARFPSNWHLSKARADTVMQRLTASVPLQRMRAEGRADTEPIAPNDSAAGRSQNRRVEIVLLAGP